MYSEERLNRADSVVTKLHVLHAMISHLIASDAIS